MDLIRVALPSRLHTMKHSAEGPNNAASTTSPRSKCPAPHLVTSSHHDHMTWRLCLRLLSYLCRSCCEANQYIGHDESIWVYVSYDLTLNEAFCMGCAGMVQEDIWKAAQASRARSWTHINWFGHGQVLYEGTVCTRALYYRHLPSQY